MLNTWRTLAAACALIYLVVPGLVRGQDDEAEAQKKRAAANWKKAFDKPPEVFVEGKSCLICAPATIGEDKAKAIGSRVDAYLTAIRKTLGLEKKPLWNGKLTVYLVAAKRDQNSLIRTIEKRRPGNTGLGSIYLRNGQQHIIACNPLETPDPPLERQVLTQLVLAAVTKFAGDNHSLPEWVLTGYIDAVGWRTTTDPAEITQRDKARKTVIKLVNATASKGTADLWGGKLTGAEEYAVRTSVVDFLAFGPDSVRFPEFVRGFKPENRQPKTIDAVLTIINSNPTKFNRVWVTWARKE